MSRQAELLAGLSSEDAGQRAAAVRQLRYGDLKQADILRQLLRTCRDTRELPEGLQDGQVADPFASFFAAPAARSDRKTFAVGMHSTTHRSPGPWPRVEPGLCAMPFS